MCKFFSLISDGKGKIFYFDWFQRQAILAKDPKFNRVETADSHSSISDFYGFKGEKADKVNKYEFNTRTSQAGATMIAAVSWQDCREKLEFWLREF